MHTKKQTNEFYLLCPLCGQGDTAFIYVMDYRILSYYASPLFYSSAVDGKAPFFLY